MYKKYDGLSSRENQTLVSKEWQHANKEKMKAYRKKWRQKFWEKEKESIRQKKGIYAVGDEVEILATGVIGFVTHVTKLGHIYVNNILTAKKKITHSTDFILSKKI